MSAGISKASRKSDLELIWKIKDWTKNELESIGESEELELSSLMKNGALGKPVAIWVVRVGDNLYVRAYRGREGSWFSRTQVLHEGRVSSGGIEKDVDFLDMNVDDTINDEIDTAYESKYRRYGAVYVNPIKETKARAATIKLVLYNHSS